MFFFNAMTSLKLFLSALVFAASGVVCVYAQSLPQGNAKNNDNGISGLIVNMTRTPDGFDFYRSFLEFWREKPDSERYSLEIGERSSKRLGNQVWVMYGQRRLFFSNLPFKLGKIRELSEQAVDTTHEALIALALQMNGPGDPDIAGDEL